MSYLVCYFCGSTRSEYCKQDYFCTLFFPRLSTLFTVVNTTRCQWVIQPKKDENTVCACKANKLKLIL